MKIGNRISAALEVVAIACALSGVAFAQTASVVVYNAVSPKVMSAFVDESQLHLKAGDGGAGRVSAHVASAATRAAAAVTQSAAILKKGFTELDPLVAIVEPEACTACGDCLTACPYDAIHMAEGGDRHFATISAANCKGCGGCVPICPENAIDLLGYTDAEVTSMIESLAEVPA